MVLWHQLTKASPDISVPHERNQARLLAALMVIFMPCAAASLLFLLFVDQFTLATLRESSFVITLIANLLCWVVYALSRTRYHRSGALLFVCFITILIFTDFVLEPLYPESLYWLTVPALVASLLLPPTLGMMLAAAQILALLLLPSFVSEMTREYAQFTALTLMAVSMLLLLFAYLRRSDLETLRKEQADLEKTSADLRRVQNELEHRIEARTRDLATTNQALLQQIAEREQAEALLAEHNRELLLLNGVLTTITSDLNVEQILTVACRELAHMLESPRCSAALFNADCTNSTVVAEFLSAADLSLVGRRFVVSEAPLMTEMLTTRKPVTALDVRQQAYEVSLQEVLTARGAVSVLMLPLFTQGEIAGSLGLSRNEARPYSEREIALGSSIAAAVSQSLYAAHLFTAEREQRTLAEALLDTARLLGNPMGLNELLDRVLDNVERVVPHDSANVMLVENGHCRVVRSRGIPPEREAWINAADFQIRSLPTLNWMRETHQACWIPDTQESSLWSQVDDTDHIRSYMGAPMFVEGELIGFIHVDNFTPHSFTLAQLEHLQAFANQVSLTIHNMRLHDQLARYAELLEQKVAERTAELALANEDLRALARVKDEFVANVSHELRTPITNLMLRQALLEKMPEKQAKHLDVMRRETQRLNRIIEDLLQLSRLDRGRVELALSPLDLNDLTAQYVADRLPLAESLGLHLTLKQRLGLAPVSVDEELVGQVLSVLLTNALNYTPVGGRIEVCTHQEEQAAHIWVGFSVADSGPGIPLTEQSRLFERFFRGTVAHEMGVPGTGLGLALAQEIIYRHSGRIEVKSTGQPGDGATFLVWFPVPEPETVWN